MRRVVVTGLGIVTPLANGIEETWKRMLACESGAGPITKFDASDLPCRIAFEVTHGDGSNGTLNMDQWLDGKEQRRNDDFIQFAMIAAQQAIKDSGYEIKTPDQQYRTGVLVGAGIGGLPSIEETKTSCATACFGNRARMRSC